MESLSKIFGGISKVKIMRLFLFSESAAFDIDDVVERSRIKKIDARKELAMLTKIGFLKKKTFSKKILKKSRKKDAKPTFIKKQTLGWVLNKRFDLVGPLQVLLIETDLVNEKDLIKRIKKTGSIKMILLSGLFTRDDARKLDLLIVGDRIKKESLEKEISIIESEIGHELRYTFFDKAEFDYRVSMYDKLIRDVLENEHITLLNIYK